MKLPDKMTINFQKELGKYTIRLEYKNNIRCKIGTKLIIIGCFLSGMKYEIVESA